MNTDRVDLFAVLSSPLDLIERPVYLLGAKEHNGNKWF